MRDTHNSTLTTKSSKRKQGDQIDRELEKNLDNIDTELSKLIDNEGYDMIVDDTVDTTEQIDSNTVLIKETTNEVNVPVSSNADDNTLGPKVVLKDGMNDVVLEVPIKSKEVTNTLKSVVGLEDDDGLNDGNNGDTVNEKSSATV